MSDPRDHERWALALEVAGVQMRPYTHIAPSGGVTSSTLLNAAGISFVDTPCLQAVGDYAWQMDAEGGIVSYEAIDLELWTDGSDAKTTDAVYTFGRVTQGAAGWTALLFETVEVDDTTIKVLDAAPSSWSYPRLIQVSGEAMRATAFAGTGGEGDEYRFTVERGVAFSPTQRHVVALGYPVPRVTEHVVHWSGRYARLLGVRLRSDGTTEDTWREIMVGVLAGPAVETAANALSLRLLPLTTLLDVEIGAGEAHEPFGLAQNVHVFSPDGPHVIEMMTQTLWRASESPDPVDDELHLYQHQFCPAGAEVAKQWPAAIAEANATFAAEVDVEGAPIRITIDPEGAVVADIDDADVSRYAIWAWSTEAAVANFWGDNPPKTLADNLPPIDDARRLIIGMDLARPQDAYPRREGDAVGQTLRVRGRSVPVRQGEWVWGLELNADVRIPVRGAANAFYEGEPFILAEKPVTVPTDGFATIQVDFFDRGLQDTATVFVRITSVTSTVIDGYGTAYKLYIHDDDLGTVPSFADWPSLPRTRMQQVTVFKAQRPARVLLELLESGTAEGVNGDYDVHPSGAGIHSRWVDEASFFRYPAPDGLDEWTTEAERGKKLEDMFAAILRATRTSLVMLSGDDGYCRITRTKIGPPADTDVVASLTQGDFTISGPGANGMDTRTYTRLHAEVAIEQGGTRQVEVPDLRGAARHFGEARTFKIDLTTSRPIPDNDPTGQIVARLLPLAGSIFFDLGDPRRTWSGAVPRSRLLLIQPGAAMSFTHPKLKTDVEAGITAEVARIMRARCPLMRGASATLTAAHHGKRVTGWNAALLVTAAPSASSVTIDADAYSDADIEGWAVGDACYAEPLGDQDNRTALTITAIAGTTVTFGGNHGLSGPDFGNIIPALYDSASALHKSAAYYSDADGKLGAADDEGVLLS